MTATGTKQIDETERKNTLIKAGKFYRIFYRLWDDSNGGLQTIFENDRFKFEIRTLLKNQTIVQPIDFRTGAGKLIEGTIFQTVQESKAISAKLYYTGKEAPFDPRSFFFNGFRLRIYYEPLNRESIIGYDAWYKDLRPEFPDKVTS